MHLSLRDEKQTFVRSVMAQKYCASMDELESCRTASDVLQASSERCHASSQAFACFFTLSSGWWYSACTASSSVCRLDIRACKSIESARPAKQKW